jgi:hypothetical protein
VTHSGIAKNVLENVPGIVRVIPLVTSVIDTLVYLMQASTSCWPSGHGVKTTGTERRCKDATSAVGATAAVLAGSGGLTLADE